MTYNVFSGTLNLTQLLRDHTVSPATHTRTIPAFTSQPQGITALWPVPTYTAWWQRHIGVRNLPRVFTLHAWLRLEPMTSWSQVRRSTDSATTPPGHYELSSLIVVVPCIRYSWNCSGRWRCFYLTDDHIRTAQQLIAFSDPHTAVAVTISLLQLLLSLSLLESR